MLWPNKNFFFSCSHCSFTIFTLISYFLYTQVMLILILIDVQYLQNVAFSTEKVSNGQTLLTFPPPNKKILSPKYSIFQTGAEFPHNHLTLFMDSHWKCTSDLQKYDFCMLVCLAFMYVLFLCLHKCMLS